VVSASVLPNGRDTNENNCGCDPDDDFGLKALVEFGVLDEEGQPILSDRMQPQETLVEHRINGVSAPEFDEPKFANIGPSPVEGTSTMTDASGRYVDAPVGVCANVAFASFSFLQTVRMKVGKETYIVRSHTITVSSDWKGEGRLVSSAGDLTLVRASSSSSSR
jgi:hypothetical protein